MISDLDETIKQLLIQKGGLDPAEIDIVFDTPDREWSSSISKPTVNIYLYDIHENVQKRDNDWQITSENGKATKKKAPIRVDLSYLVTVWTNDMTDQHRLLGHIVTTLFSHKEIPDDLLQGELNDPAYPIITHTAQQDGVLRNSADFWSALDNQLKPSISYVVTIPVDLAKHVIAPQVRTKVLRTHERTKEVSSGDTWIQISGAVHEKGKPHKGIPQAMVLIKEMQKSVVTGDDGAYSFRGVRPGDYTFEVLAQGRKRKSFGITVPSADYDIGM